MTLRSATLDCLFHELYATAVQQPSGDALWERLSGGLSEVLSLPLVLVGQYEPQGVVSVLATSRASRLWSDLQRLPERWDGSVVGRSLAAMALDSGTAATLALEDERFLCWREGADRDRLRSGCAIMIDSALGQYLLELFSPEPGIGDDTLARLVEIRERLNRFLGDVAVLREQRLLARALDGAGNAAFITDRDGTIVWCNRAFTRLYGYEREEAIGENPRFLKSGRQGVRYYRDLWSTIRSGKVWAGETVDRDRNGIAYTVRQTISPFACDDHMSHFLALHDDVSRENAQRLRQELRTGVDPVTGLLTRAAFEARVSSTPAETHVHWSLLLLSLRDFEQGVAALGADLAEAIAAQVGARIREAIGEHATAALLGSGEYGVQILPNGADPTEEVAHRLIESLARPFPQLDATIVPKPRVAAAHYPADGGDFDALIHHADRQLADRPMTRARL